MRIPRHSARLADRLLIVTWALALAVPVAASDAFTDNLWMAREGEAVLQGAQFLHTNQWSWADGAVPFVPTSPGWQVLLGEAWSWAGISGLYGFGLLAVTASLLTLAWVARILGARSAGTVLALVLLGLLPTTLSTRPALAGPTLLVAELGWVWNLRPRLLRWPTWRSALVIGTTTFVTAALGIWVHASWTAFSVASGLAIAAMLWQPAPASQDRQVAISAAAIAGGLLGATTGPSGLSVWEQALRVQAVCAGLLTEWSPPWQGEQPWVSTSLWLLVLTLVLGLGAGLLRARALTPRVAWVLLALAAGSVVATANAARFIVPATVFVAPLLAAQLSRFMAPTYTSRLRRVMGERAGDSYWTVILSALCVVLLPAMIAMSQPLPILHDPAIASLPRDCRLFAPATTSNAVLLARPDAHVWIDGRADMWGRNRLLEAARYWRVDDPRNLVPAGTSCVLIGRASAVPLRAALEASADWQRTARSGQLELWSRLTLH